MRKERELEEEKKQRHKDIMHNLSIKFNQMITTKINEQAYEIRIRALKHKDNLRKSETIP